MDDQPNNIRNSPTSTPTPSSPEKLHRIEQQLARRDAELAVINSLQAALAARLDMQGIYDAVGEQIRDVFDAQGMAISIYDAAGRRICEVFSGDVVPGVNHFSWNGTDGSGRELASGVYFCKIEVGSISISRKMLKIR